MTFQTLDIRQWRWVIIKKQEGFANTLTGGCWHGRAGGGLTKSKVPCYCLGEHIWLSVAGPELEAGEKIKEAGSYWPSPDRFGPNATEVMVWRPGMVAAEVVSQTSIFIQALTTVHLYNWPINGRGICIQGRNKERMPTLTIFIKNSVGGASLVAQWLRICLPMQGTRVRALVWEDPTCRGATKPVSHNYWVCASGACAPQQERPRQWEAHAPRWRVAPACRN